MKAIVARPPTKNSAELIDVQRPVPTDEEVLLRIIRVGIDGTDRDINEGFYGVPPEGSDYLVLGHEALARIHELGANVQGFNEGELVVPTVRRPDDCLNCKIGESDMCLKGNYKEHGIFKLHGFASEYAASDADFLVGIPEELEGVAVLLEPLSVAEKALYQCHKIQQRMVWDPTSALVLGAGPLGLLATMLLRIQGFDVWTLATRPKGGIKPIIVEEVGAEYINVKETPLASVRKGFDVIFEATGNPQVAFNAMSMLNNNAVLCLLGIYPDSTISENIGKLLTGVVLGNKLYFGSVNANRKYFEAGIKHLVEMNQRFPSSLRKLFTSSLRPEEYHRAFQPGEDEIKTVIEF